MVATYGEHGCQDGFCMVATYEERGCPDGLNLPPDHMRASEKELAVLKSPLEQKSMFKRQKRMLRRQERQRLAKDAKIQRRIWDPGIKSLQDNTLRARYYYTCHQCDYSLHKLYAKLPTTLRHESHRDHILILFNPGTRLTYKRGSSDTPN
nr:B-box-type zinc finger, zinc finger, PHD-type, DC1 [Tanacetum cinerariifolium]